MKLYEIVDTLSLEVKTASSYLTKEVTGGYVSDLLSDVMANSKEGNIWITIQTHQNIVAVAALKDLSGIILVNNRMPDPEALKNAESQGIPILVSSLPAFELVGKLYILGLRC
ncbi:MAG: serine kinase [Nitrospirota bacterium]